MKILLDEDTPVQLLGPIRHLLGSRHRVDHVTSLGWYGKSDIPIFHDAARRGYQAVITIDSNQLDDADETKAIKRSGVHHVRFTQRHEGRRGLGLAMGAVISSIVLIVDALEASPGQRLVQISGIDPTPTKRFTVVDPAVEPPRYWR